MRRESYKIDTPRRFGRERCDSLALVVKPTLRVQWGRPFKIQVQCFDDSKQERVMALLDTRLSAPRESVQLNFGGVSQFCSVTPPIRDSERCLGKVELHNIVLFRSLDFEGPTRPLPYKNPLVKVGGEAPHRFPPVLGRRGGRLPWISG